MRDMLDILLRVRKEFAYGAQHDYFDHPDIVGWTREGDAEHLNSGLAALITNGPGGQKNMYVGKKFAGQKFFDCTGNIEGDVIINEDGTGDFKVNGGSCSVWVRRQIEVIDGEFCVCKLSGDAQVNFKDSDFAFFAKTDSELSLITRLENAPADAAKEPGYSLLRFSGQLGLSLTGILSHALEALAGCKISVLAVSTYDTDYIMVKRDKLSQSLKGLKEAGYLV